MPARFDDLVPFDGETVIAIGPLHPTEKVVEVCAWIYQERNGNGRGYAAATEMTTDPAGAEGFQQIEGNRWLLPLKQVSDAGLQPGRAFAVAVALVGNWPTPNGQRVVWWGQPIDIQEDAAAVAAAKQPNALTKPPLSSPAPFPPSTSA
jgi:hypothetical protein